MIKITKILCLKLINILLSSCIFIYDPYEMEIFSPTNGTNIHTVNRDIEVGMYIQNSGVYDDEAKSPYKFHISVRSENRSYTEFSVLEFKATTENVSVHEEHIKLQELKRNSCCIHKGASNWLEIIHKDGDELHVTFHLKYKLDGEQISLFVEKRFKAKVKSGNFQMVPV